MDKLCDPVKGTICHWSEVRLCFFLLQLCLYSLFFSFFSLLFTFMLFIPSLHLCLLLESQCFDFPACSFFYFVCILKKRKTSLFHNYEFGDRFFQCSFPLTAHSKQPRGHQSAQQGRYWIIAASLARPGSSDGSSGKVLALWQAESEYHLPMSDFYVSCFFGYEFLKVVIMAGRTVDSSLLTMCLRLYPSLEICVGIQDRSTCLVF